MNRHRQKTGFTLVEILIVVLIIGILMSIAVPNFVTARSSSRLNTVYANLRQIDAAKEQCSMDLGATAGDTTKCTNTTMVPVYMKTWPVNTPVVGVYAENAVGTNATFKGKDMAAWAADHTGL